MARTLLALFIVAGLSLIGTGQASAAECYPNRCETPPVTAAPPERALEAPVSPDMGFPVTGADSVSLALLGAFIVLCGGLVVFYNREKKP